MVERFLKDFPYLKPVRINNMFDRFLKTSNGSILFLYNKKRDTYELHSIKSFKYTGESINAVVPDEVIHGWLIKDFGANNVQKFGDKVSADRDFTNQLMDNYENRGLELLQKRALTTIEKMIGRDL